mmetsp:Transcript_137502/g.439347  ORF Transcript_137502/g.439347 Transcript_137502/m.439347 type:complete len:324 (+) Transcript_137502:284-1255(+)
MAMAATLGSALRRAHQWGHREAHPPAQRASTSPDACLDHRPSRSRTLGGLLHRQRPKPRVRHRTGDGERPTLQTRASAARHPRAAATGLEAPRRPSPPPPPRSPCGCPPVPELAHVRTRLSSTRLPLHSASFSAEAQARSLASGADSCSRRGRPAPGTSPRCPPHARPRAPRRPPSAQAACAQRHPRLLASRPRTPCCLMSLRWSHRATRPRSLRENAGPRPPSAKTRWRPELPWRRGRACGRPRTGPPHTAAARRAPARISGARPASKASSAPRSSSPARCPPHPRSHPSRHPSPPRPAPLRVRCRRAGLSPPSRRPTRRRP